MKLIKSNLAKATSLTMLLTACGGGGGSSGGSTPQTPTASDVANYATNTTVLTVTTTTKTQSTIATNISTPTYAANSDELSAFNYLNQQRLSCGFGSLNQDLKLDQAALNHNNYMAANNVWGHYESSGLKFFTGGDVGQRVDYVGYSYSYASETIDQVTQAEAIDHGKVAIMDLMGVPYHSLALLGGYKDVGISVTDYATVDLGVKIGDVMQSPASDEVLTYPCQNTGEIFYKNNVLYEIPSPVPAERNLGLNPIGHPILIRLKPGNILKITSASLIKVSTGESVTLRAPYIKETDLVNSNQYPDYSSGFVLPDVAQEPNTLYEATINGLNNGVPFVKKFTYSTGKDSVNTLHGGKY